MVAVKRSTQELDKRIRALYLNHDTSDILEILAKHGEFVSKWRCYDAKRRYLPPKNSKR